MSWKIFTLPDTFQVFTSERALLTTAGKYGSLPPTGQPSQPLLSRATLSIPKASRPQMRYSSR